MPGRDEGVKPGELIAGHPVLFWRGMKSIRVSNSRDLVRVISELESRGYRLLAEGDVPDDVTSGRKLPERAEGDVVVVYHEIHNGPRVDVDWYAYARPPARLVVRGTDVLCPGPSPLVTSYERVYEL